MARALLLLLVAACGGQEQPGFDIVRLPQTAYMPAPDAAASPDSGPPDAGPRPAGSFRPVIPPLCFAPPTKPPSEDDSAGDPYPECLGYRTGNQYLDRERTERVRGKVQKPVCCYSVNQGVE